MLSDTVTVVRLISIGSAADESQSPHALPGNGCIEAFRHTEVELIQDCEGNTGSEGHTEWDRGVELSGSFGAGLGLQPSAREGVAIEVRAGIRAQ